MKILNEEMFLVTFFVTLILIYLIFSTVFYLLLKQMARPKHILFNWYMQVLFEQLRPSLFYANCQRFGLTKTEIAVTRLLCQGLTTQETADKLFVATETVKKHTQNIFRKTGVNNRLALAHAMEQKAEIVEF